MGWMQSIIFTQVVDLFVDWEIDTRLRRLIQDNAGRRTFLTFFKKDRFLDLMVIKFENTASHKYLVQKSKSLWMARSQMNEHSVLVLIQKWHKLNCFENSSCKRLSFNNSANSSRAWQVCALLKFSIVYGLWIQLFLNQSPKCFWNCFNFSLKLLGVLSKQLA